MGTDQVKVTYDRLGRKETLTDQRGVMHEYVYDAAGRLEADKITSLGSSGIVDNRVMRIQRAYMMVNHGISTNPTVSPFQPAGPVPGNAHLSEPHRTAIEQGRAGSTAVRAGLNATNEAWEGINTVRFIAVKDSNGYKYFTMIANPDTPSARLLPFRRSVDAKLNFVTSGSAILYRWLEFVSDHKSNHPEDAGL